MGCCRWVISTTTEHHARPSGILSQDFDLVGVVLSGLKPRTPLNQGVRGWGLNSPSAQALEIQASAQHWSDNEPWQGFSWCACSSNSDPALKQTTGQRKSKGGIDIFSFPAQKNHKTLTWVNLKPEMDCVLSEHWKKGNKTWMQP